MAARFWIGGGTNTNWNASPTTNWAATSGGTTRVAAPTVSDDVTFDGAGATGNSASIVSATISCLSLTFTSGYTNTLTVNNPLTIAGNFTDNTAHAWAGSSGIVISAASTITSNGKTLPLTVTFSGANTKTLSGDWTITGSLTVSGVTTITSGTLNIGNGLTINATTSGTTVLNMNGTGTINLASVLNNNLTLSSGTLTFTNGNTHQYGTGTLTYSGGTVVTTNTTLQFASSTTLNTNGVTWNNASVINTGITITINSLFTMSGTFTIGAENTVTFAGTAGWTCATLTCSQTVSRTITLVNGVTYTITSAFNCFRSSFGSMMLFTSNDATLKAILKLNQGATCNVMASFTRIDASGGRTINTFNGTVTSCFNINSFNDLKTIAAAMVA